MLYRRLRLFECRHLAGEVVANHNGGACLALTLLLPDLTFIVEGKTKLKIKENFGQQEATGSFKLGAYERLELEEKYAS